MIQIPEIANEEKEKNKLEENFLKSLKQQIKRAEDMLDTGQKREELLKSEARQLKHDIVNLNNTIKQVYFGSY